MQGLGCRRRVRLVRLAAGLAACLAAILAAGLASCAALDSDIHLAPLYTRIATADGGTLVEAAGGIYRQHRRDEGGFLEWQTLAPLWGIERQRNGDYVAEHPFLLGRTRHFGTDTTSYLVPLYLTWSRTNSEGEKRSLLFALPGFLHERRGEKNHYGWFPFYGKFEDLLTFDEASFVLWPLYVHNDRAGRVSNHVLWPLIGWTRGGGESSWHVFPLIGRASREDRYDRTYVLWPFLHWQRNNLGGGGEEPETAWWLFPLLGHKERGTYRSWSFLWPLFGFSHDSRSGFWALDFPFFLVRIQRGPDETKRTRFWPFWSRLEIEGLEDTSFLWPLGHLRHEDTPAMERDTATFVPFWQSWDRRDKATGEETSYRKLWPLYRYDDQGDWKAGSLLELDPFFRNDMVPRHLTGIFRLYEWEEDPSFRRERSFLGLYRRERGRGEDRRSLAGLWASRRYGDEGARVRETSLLFGLLRWRVTEGEGFDMLRPAFPGPGWPRPAEAAIAAESRSYF
jgi:hypothetical protein